MPTMATWGRARAASPSTGDATVVARNIPQEEALDRLVELIRAHGDWVDPEV